MRIIDFRYRPATPESIQTVVDNPVYKNICHRTPFARQKTVSLAEAIAEIRALGVEKAVVTGRDIETTYRAEANNDMVLDWVRRAPELFVGFYGYDPGKGMQAAKAVRAAVEQGDFKGAAIDPPMSHLPMDHPRFYMLYTICCELGIPVEVTSGLSPFMPNVTLDCAHPLHLDRVATDFPDLTIIMSHAGYPWVAETLAVAMRHDNVFLDFSCVEGMPGVREQLVYAAGHPTLGSRVLFSSASPFVPFTDALQTYMDLGLMQETLQHVLYDNAAALLS